MGLGVYGVGLRILKRVCGDRQDLGPKNPRIHHLGFV